MLQVLPNDKYSVTKKADADTKRLYPALTGVTGGALVIGGRDLSSVSKYNIASDIWEGGLPPLDQDRSSASACTLQAKIYVFTGLNH